MTWFFAILIVALIGAIAVVAAGHGDPLEPAQTDLMTTTLPEADLSAEDLRRVRFNTVLRGYRASEVDALLDRLARQLHEREPDGSDPGQSAGSRRPDDQPT